MGALWHPFSDMGAVERDGGFVIARGEGAYVFDPAGAVTWTRPPGCGSQRRARPDGAR